MSFFSEENNDAALNNWKQNLFETKQRFFIFIEKLEARLKEFTALSIPELKEIMKTDTDEFKRAYYRLKSAIDGQLQSIRQKASEVMEEKIAHLAIPESCGDFDMAYFHFRNDCFEKFGKFESLCNECLRQISDTAFRDYETAYQKIADEFDSIKNKFRCIQCGSPVTVDKIYFTTTYITCPACKTKNTFEPSSQARMLEQIARKLAEQRTAYMLEEYHTLPEKEQELYLTAHQLKLSLVHETDRNIIEQKENEIKRLETQRTALSTRKPILYQTYLRAMFDEWNKINPDLKDEHERFYERLLID